MRKLFVAMFVAFYCCASAAMPETTQLSFPRVEAKTFDKEDFIFPEDLHGERLNVLFLAMAKDQDTGEYLQKALIDWQIELEQRGVLDDSVIAWHFSVISGVPFFIKGIVTRAMRKEYSGKVPLDQAGILFVDDIDEFSADAKLPIDDKPTIVITTTDGYQLRTFKGDVTPAIADEVAAAIQALLVDLD